jgi:hypothetical protein
MPLKKSFPQSHEGSLLAPLYTLLSSTLLVEIHSLKDVSKYIFFSIFLISPTLVDEVYSLLVSLKDISSASIAIGFVLMKYHIYFLVALRYSMYSTSQNAFIKVIRFVLTRLASWMYLMNSDWDSTYPDIYSTYFWASHYGYWCMFSFFFTMFNCVAIGYIVVYFLQVEQEHQLKNIIRRGPSLRDLLASYEARPPVHVLLDRPQTFRCLSNRILYKYYGTEFNSRHTLLR